jgi:hypothetical protein
MFTRLMGWKSQGFAPIWRRASTNSSSENRMPPAVIAAGVVAAGTIGGAVLGQHAQSKAASQAADTQNAATAAELQLGQESLALNKDIYNSNYDTLSPFVSRGNVAGDALNALLGLPAAPVMHSPLAASSTGPAPAAGGSHHRA